MQKHVSYILSFSVILIMALVHPFAVAETFIINAGGGGEPLTDDANQFLSPLREAERLGTAKGARVFSLFNSDTWPRDQFANPESVKPFNDENLLATIDTVKQHMRESKGKNQVMLHINTHGSPNDHTGTHRWATDDKRWIDPDTLLVKIQELLMRGANVALVDQSCFSGNTLLVFKDLLKMYPDQLCILTGATQFGYGRSGGIIDKIVHNFLSSEKEQSLEDVFWKTYMDPKNIELSALRGGIAQTSSIEFENFLHPLEYLDFPMPTFKEPDFRGLDALEQVPLHLQSLVCEAESSLTVVAIEKTVENTTKVFLEMAKSEIKKAQEKIPYIKKIIELTKREKDDFQREFAILPMVGEMPKTLCTEIETKTQGNDKLTYCTVGKYRMRCYDWSDSPDTCEIDASEPYTVLNTYIERGRFNRSYLNDEQMAFFDNFLNKEGPSLEYSRKKRALEESIKFNERELEELKTRLYKIAPSLIQTVYQKKKLNGEVRRACENFSL